MKIVGRVFLEDGKVFFDDCCSFVKMSYGEIYYGGVFDGSIGDVEKGVELEWFVIKWSVFVVVGIWVVFEIYEL